AEHRPTKKGERKQQKEGGPNRGKIRAIDNRYCHRQEFRRYRAARRCSKTRRPRRAKAGGATWCDTIVPSTKSPCPFPPWTPSRKSSRSCAPAADDPKSESP